MLPWSGGKNKIFLSYDKNIIDVNDKELELDSIYLENFELLLFSYLLVYIKGLCYYVCPLTIKIMYRRASTSSSII